MYAFPSAGVLGLLLCSSLFAQTAQARPAAAKSNPEVILLGTAHDLHFKAESHYSLADLRTEVEALHPDLICGEITPEAYQGPMEGYFPPEAAFLAEVAPTLRARFAATDWRITKAWQSRAEEMEPKEIKDKVEALTEETTTQMRSQTEPTLFDFLHTKGVAVSDYQFEQVVGENTVSDIAMGGWHERNRRIVENCLDADAGSRRIVIVYGAGHIPQLQRQLAARGITAQIASRLFVPGGMGNVPSSVIARWQRNLDNLKRILDGSIAVSRDSLDKVKDSHRIQDLELALKTYSGGAEKK
ncbi:MAG: hypothetical protein ABSF85_03050 [Terriglobales bacterium]|jgi:hypothetical protein